jgi:hypothetical protein
VATLKNTLISGSLQLPSGTTAQRPAFPPNGAVRYNTDLGYAEVYVAGYWGDLATGSGLPIMDNLVLHLDANHPDSNTGSGGTWFDLTDNNSDANLVGVTRTTNTTLASGQQNVMQVNGNTSSYIELLAANAPAVDLRNTTEGYSVICLARNYTTQGRMWNGRQNNWLLGHWSTGQTEHYAEGWIYGASGGGARITGDTNWRVYGCTGKVDTDNYTFWVDGQMVAGPTDTGGSQGPYGLVCGIYGNTMNSEVSSGQTAMIMAYNKALDEAEMKQTIFAVMNRYQVPHRQVYTLG